MVCHNVLISHLRSLSLSHTHTDLEVDEEDAERAEATGRVVDALDIKARAVDCLDCRRLAILEKVELAVEIEGRVCE